MEGSKEELGNLITDYYNEQGEFAGRYEIVGITSIKHLVKQDRLVTVQVWYAYGRRGTPQGHDARRFDLELRGGAWVVTRMYH